MVQTAGLRFEVEASGAGERLALCLHGFPECSYSWRFQLPLLAQLGYRAWAPNLRGYGASSRPRGLAEYTLEKLMQDVADLIDASGARSTVLVAHDWGAIVAWFFAMRRVRPLERLVIVNVPHPGAVNADGLDWRQLIRSWYMFFFQLPLLPEWLLARWRCWPIGAAFRLAAVDRSRFPDEVLEVYRRHAAIPGALTAMVNWYRGLLRGGSLRRQRALGYPVIDVPTLLVWGEADMNLRKETTRHTDRFVRDLTVRYLPGVSHWVQQEAPETVNALLEAWLTGREVPQAPGA